MRMIGMIGGMSWESSAQYYRIINEGVRDRLGPTASARCLLWSFDFSEIESLQHAGDWTALSERMMDAARRLEVAGADLLLICTNTMHRIAAAVEAAVNIPLLHIADPTAERIKATHVRKVGLLGTAFTMEHSFYKGRLVERHGLEVIVPDRKDRGIVHRVIYEELVTGRVLPSSRNDFRQIIARLAENGAEAVILGCTEIMLLVTPEDSPVPIFDTTALHATAAVERALDVIPLSEK
jgi:aspartate racemase